MGGLAHLSAGLVRATGDTHCDPLPVVVVAVLVDGANERLVFLGGPRTSYAALGRHILSSSIFDGASSRL